MEKKNSSPTIYDLAGVREAFELDGEWRANGGGNGDGKKEVINIAPKRMALAPLHSLSLLFLFKKKREKS